jgi:hypothetical protein
MTRPAMKSAVERERERAAVLFVRRQIENAIAIENAACAEIVERHRQRVIALARTAQQPARHHLEIESGRLVNLHECIRARVPAPQPRRKAQGRSKRNG